MDPTTHGELEEQTVLGTVKIDDQQYRNVELTAHECEGVELIADTEDTNLSVLVTRENAGKLAEVFDQS